MKKKVEEEISNIKALFNDWDFEPEDKIVVDSIGSAIALATVGRYGASLYKIAKAYRYFSIYDDCHYEIMHENFSRISRLAHSQSIEEDDKEAELASSRLVLETIEDDVEAIQFIDQAEERLGYCLDFTKVKARRFVNLGCVEKVHESFLLLFKSGCYEAKAYNCYARCLVDLGFDDEAIQQYEKAYELDPTYVLAISNASRVFKRKGDFKSVIAWLERIPLSHRESIPRVKCLLAEAYFSLGKYQQAFNMFKKSIDYERIIDQHLYCALSAYHLNESDLMRESVMMHLDHIHTCDDEYKYEKLISFLASNSYNEILDIIKEESISLN